MDTSRKSTPSSSAMRWALDLVRLVVPKQGMDTAWIPLWSRPSRSKGAGRHQQGQGGIQPAGKAHHRRLAVDMLQPGGQAHALHGQDPLAPVGKAHRVLGGTKGVRAKSRWGNKGRQRSPLS